MTLFYRLALSFLLGFYPALLSAQWHPHPDSVTRITETMYSTWDILPTPSGGAWLTFLDEYYDATVQYIDENAKPALPGRGIDMKINFGIIRNPEVDPSGGLFFELENYWTSGKWLASVSSAGRLRFLKQADSLSVGILPVDSTTIYRWFPSTNGQHNISAVKSGDVKWRTALPVKVFDGERKRELIMYDTWQPWRGMIVTPDKGIAIFGTKADSLILLRFDSLGKVSYPRGQLIGRGNLIGDFPSGEKTGFFNLYNSVSGNIKELYFQQVDINGTAQFPGYGLLISKSSPPYDSPVKALETDNKYYILTQKYNADSLRGSLIVRVFSKTGEALWGQSGITLSGQGPTYTRDLDYVNMLPDGEGVYVIWKKRISDDVVTAVVQYITAKGEVFEAGGRPLINEKSAYVTSCALSMNQNTKEINAFTSAYVGSTPIVFGRRINCPGCNVVLTKVTPSRTSVCAGGSVAASYLTHGLPANTSYRGELVSARQPTIALGTQTGTNPTFALPASVPAGGYQLRITAIGTFTATALSADTIQVQAPPAITLTSNSPVAQGETLRLSAAGGQTYRWEGPSGFTSTSASVSINSAVPAQSGTYSVTAASAAGCVATASVAVVVSPVLGAEPTLQSAFRAYPNPAGSQLTIEQPNLRQPQTLQVLNVHGRVVRQYVLMHEKQQIDVAALPAGVYWLRPSDTATGAAVRFVKL